MEFTKIEQVAIEQSVLKEEGAKGATITELLDLQLSAVGGGMGEPAYN